MTHLNDKDKKAQMESMKAFDEQMPSVGIFWDDPEDHSLFGVRKKEQTPYIGGGGSGERDAVYQLSSFASSGMGQGVRKPNRP